MTVWEEIERSLFDLYGLPHNRVWCREKGTTPEAQVKRVLSEIRSGLAGVPKKEEFLGPRLFLRVVGNTNRAYSGEWWFDADLLQNLDRAYSRIYFRGADRNEAIRNMLREILAISKEWNAILEVWALDLPPGEKLAGFSGFGTPQKLFGSMPVTEKGNRMLVGKARQIFFPVKNPLWVTCYRQLGV